MTPQNHPLDSLKTQICNCRAGKSSIDAMTDMELNIDPVTVAKNICVEIETVRKKLQSLCGQLAMTNDTAKEMARNELCRALVERLELAEREALELVEMIVSAQKSS
jgi:hypothetical protein